MNISQGTPADWLLGTFKKNPEGLLLLAAGAVLMMRQGGNGSTQAVASEAPSRMTEAAESFRNTAADMTDRTVRSASEMAAQASDYASQATRQAADYATEATRKVSQQSERVIRQAQSTIRDTVDRVLKDQPLMVVVAGLAAGAAVASVFPSTELEKEALSPIGERMTEAATRAGEQLKEATFAAGETLKKAAEQRGLNAEGLKDVASEAAGAFKERMGGSGGSQSEPQSGPRSSGSESGPQFGPRSSGSQSGPQSGSR